MRQDDPLTDPLFIRNSGAWKFPVLAAGVDPITTVTKPVAAGLSANTERFSFARRYKFVVLVDKRRGFKNEEIREWRL